MELENYKKNLEETVKELLDKMGFKATVYTAMTVSSRDTNTQPTISVEIQLEESKYLIGKYGANLSALQHLVRIVMKKKYGEENINFIVDVNGYKEDQRQAIIDLAQETAQKALRDKKAMVLRPMNAYERRIVHTEISQIEGVKSESVGEGEERKVVVKPSSELD